MFDVIPLELWLAFVTASAVLVIIPGPVVTFVVANSIAFGTTRGLLGIVGSTVGTGLLLAAFGVGMASVLTALADWFDVLRWLGAAYLVWLGIQHFRAEPVTVTEAMAEKRPGRSIVVQGFLIAITNPKSILFFAAFLPQFMDPALPPGPQLAVLSLTFMAVAFLLDGVWAVVSGRIRYFFTSRARARLRNRISGGLLILTGIAVALARRG